MAKLLNEGCWDLSPVVGIGTEWWPGLRLERKPLSWGPADGDQLLMRVGGSCDVHVFNGFPGHVGSHADAPGHYHETGVSIAELDPLRYVGRCQVKHVTVGHDGAITPDLIGGLVNESRLLLRTGTFLDGWNMERLPAYPTADLIRFLAEHGVTLLGIDGPSMDRHDSKELPSHHAMQTAGMLNLEWLDLEGVPEGDNYVLSAAPIKLNNDGAQVRALLFTIPAWHAFARVS